MSEGFTHHEYSKEKRDLIARTVAQGASEDELEVFLHLCSRTGLDPVARQIHLVKRGNRCTVQTGIDGYRLIADRTGKYAGSDDYRFDEGIDVYHHQNGKRGLPVTATVTVYKMVAQQRCPFTATVRWDEYYPGRQQGFMWDKMPYLMLGKTAEALALRKAFPAELSGLYTDEEMQQADAEGSPVASADDRGGQIPDAIRQRESGKMEQSRGSQAGRASAGRGREGSQNQRGSNKSQPKGAQGQRVAGSNRITRDEREKIIEVARANGWEDAEVRYLLSKRYAAESTKDVLVMDYTSIMGDLKNEDARSEIRGQYSSMQLGTASAQA